MAVTYTVAQWEAQQSTLDAGLPFTIEDTAFNITAAFDALDLDSHIAHIIISDNAAVTVTTNQLFVTDSHAISILKNANNSAYTLVVSDTGAAITTYLNNLQTNTHVTQIVVASGVVDATVAQLASDSTALANLKTSVGGSQSSIAVSDTSAHLHSGWANVAADGQVSSIVISDNTPLNLTATQASQTSAVEKLVYGNSTTSDIVLVKDTSAHIESDLSQLNTVSSFIATVTVSDNTFETLSAGQVASDLAILEKVVFSSGPATFNVSDSSANVSTNLDALESLSGSISSIAVNSSSITVSIAQLSNDSDALALITYNSNPISVAVADTASNISGNLATLEAAIEAASPPITTISVTDSNAINATITQLTDDAAVISALTGTYTLNVSDTASNISGDLDNLQTLAHSGNISAINVTDSGAIAVTVAQITSDAAAIAELVNNDTNPYTLAVTDTGSDISAALDTLSANTHVATITISPSGALALTAAQFTGGLTALGEITGSFTVGVTGATAAQAATIAGDFGALSNEGSGTLTITVSDTALAISGALVALGSNSYVTTVAISDSNPLSLTEANFTDAGHDAGLAKMTGTYTIDVTGVTVAEVPTVEGVTGTGGSYTLSIAVSDIGANLTNTALGNLGLNSLVTSITDTSGAITLTEGQFTTPAVDSGLAKMIGSYTVDVTGVTVAQLSTVEGASLPGTPTLSIAVSDTGAHISSVLLALANDSDVTSIAVNDSNPITVTATQLTTTDVSGAFGKMTGSYTLDVTGVAVSQVAGFEAVLDDAGMTLSLAVSDTGAHITDAALTSLGSDSKVTSISVSDSNPITLTEAQFTGSPENAGLAKMLGAYTVDVTGVTVAEVSAVEGVTGLGGTPTLSIAVSDTNTNITSSALSSLGLDGDVTSIAVTGGPLSLTEAQFTTSGVDSGLAKMTGAYTVDVTGVSITQVPTVEGVTLGGTPTVSIAVSDDGLSFTGTNLSTLGADNKVTSISVSSNSIVLGESDFTNAGADVGLGKMTGSYSIVATSVTVAEVPTVEGVSLGGTPNLLIQIIDIGSNLTAAVLSAFGSSSTIQVINDSSGPITLTEGQYTDSGVQAGLAKMGSTFPYTVDVTSVTVAQVPTVEAVTGLGGTPTLSIAVSDVASQIAGALSTLGGDSKVTSIAVNDSNPISLAEAAFIGDATGLAKMTGAYAITVGLVTVGEVSTVENESLGGTPTLTINVQDVGANLTSSALSTLGADSKVVHISVSSGTISLTESQFTNSGVDAGFAKMNGAYTVAVSGVTAAQVAAVEAVPLNGSPTLHIAVSDSGASLTAAQLTALGSNPNVTAIATSSPITLTETQFTTAGVDAGLAKMSGAYTIDVTGVTVAQVPTVEAVTGLGGTPTLSIAVSDIGSNITAGRLVAFGADPKVTSIAVSSGALSLTQTQFTAAGEDAGLAKMTGAYAMNVTAVGVAFVTTVEAVSLGGTPTLSIAVADIGSRINSAQLVTLGADSKVTSITVTSGAVTLSQNQILAAADHAGLLKLTGAYTVDATFVTVAKVAAVEAVTMGGTRSLSIAVSDTATNLTPSALSTLGGDSKVTSISVTSGAIVMFEAPFTNAGTDAGLAKMTGAYTITAIGVTVAQVPTVEAVTLGGTPTFQIQVADLGSNLTAAVLAAFGSNSKIGLMEASSGPITLTYTQFTNAGVDAGLAKMGAGYTVDVTGVGVGQVSGVENQTGLGGSPILSIAVSDIGANITSAALSTLGADSKVASIAVSDSNPITLTEAQFVAAADDAGLAKMTGAYTVDVTGVSVSQVPAVEAITGLGGTPTLSIAVVDAGSNITSAALVSFGADPDVTSITATNPGPHSLRLHGTPLTGGTITLTEAQFTAAADDAGLHKMIGSYTVHVTGVSVTQVPAVEAITGLGGTPTLSIAVNDIGGNFTNTALTNLGSDADVTSIAVSSGVISLAEADFTNANVDAGLDKVTGSYTVDVSGVQVSQIGAVEGITLTVPPTLSIAVSDTGSAVSGDFAGLGNDAKVTSITVLSGVIALTESAYSNSGDIAALGKMTGSYTVDVTGVSVAQVATVENATYGGAPTLLIAVSDLGSNVTDAALQSLGADNDISTIAVSSPITLTESQFTGSAEHAGLAKMTGSYTVDVTGVTVAQVSPVEGVTGLGGSPTLSIAVRDTGANITAAALGTLGVDSRVTSITDTSGPISLTEGQFTNSGPGSNPPGNHIDLNVSNIAEGLAKMTGSYTIDVSGVTVGEVSAVEGVGGLGGSPTLSIAVSDSGAHITDAALQTLGADGDVASIAVSVGPIELTEAQFTGTPEAAGLAKMTGAYQVEVSGVTVAEVSAVEGVTLGGAPSLGIGISDIGSNLTSAALVSLGSDSKVVLIQDTSGAISLTESQFTNAGDDAGLAKMTGAYTVDISGVSVAQLSGVEGQTGLGGSPTLSIGVVDTGAAITDAELRSLGADGHVATIALSSGTISLTEGQITGTPEEAGLDKMTGTFDIAVSGVTAVQVAAVEAVTISGSPDFSIAVSDTGADLTDAALASLGPDGKVTSIAVTSGAIALTEAQFVGASEDEAFGKMTGAYTVDVSNVTVGELVGVEFVTLPGAPTLSIAVSDTGGHITSGSLVSMGSDANVTSIAVTSGAISLTEAQFVAAADVKGLEKITSSFIVDVTGVTTAQVSTVTTDFGNLTNSGSGTLAIYVSDTAGHVGNAAPQLNTAGNIAGVAVTDTAAHVTSWLDILNGVAALDSITLTDSTPVLTLTESTFVGGVLALDTIQNTGVTMTVTATASQAATVASDFTGLTDDSHFTFTIAVADNAANVASNASALNSDPYASIHVTDNDANVIANILTLDTVSGLSAVTLTNATPALTLTATQMEGAVNVLTDVTNSSVSIFVTDVSVAQLRPVVSAYFDVIEARQTNPFLSFSIAMSDTAANIEDGLGTNGQFRSGSNISSITVSDGQPLNFEYGYNYFSNLLSKLTGTDTVNVTDVTGQAYSAFTNVYINGSIVETIDYNNDGSTTATGNANGLTFTPAGPSAHPKSITVTGHHSESFDFTGNFGNVTITGFNVNNDMIVFNSAEFSNVAAVELHTTAVNGNAVVTLDSGDTITLSGITVAQFEAHSTDWSFSSFT